MAVADTPSAALLLRLQAKHRGTFSSVPNADAAWLLGAVLSKWQGGEQQQQYKRPSNSSEGRTVLSFFPCFLVQPRLLLSSFALLAFWLNLPPLLPSQAACVGAHIRIRCLMCEQHILI